MIQKWLILSLLSVFVAPVAAQPPKLMTKVPTTSIATEALKLKVPVATSPPPPAPIPKPIGQHVQISNITAGQYQKRFDELTRQGYRPMKVSSKRLQVIDYTDGEVPRLGYWATFQKVENSYAWVARHGLTNQAYSQEFDAWAAKGYMPTDINVAVMDGQESYCVIFEKVPNPPAWVARHGLNQVQMQQASTEFAQQGYKIQLKSSHVKNGGWVHAAVWVKK
jgi:hypothetical protein